MFSELITELLLDGYKVNFSAPGHSMYPTIMANQTILVEPIDPWMVRQGDIILYRTNGRLIAHRVMRIEKLPDDSLRTFRSSEPARLPNRLNSEKPNFKHSAPPAQHSSEEVLHFVLRGDAAATFDDPVPADQICGKVVAVEKNGRCINPYSLRHQLACRLHKWASRLKSISSLLNFSG